MNKDTTVIVDHGSALFGTYTAGFFCKDEITVENIVAEISKRLGVECTTTGSVSYTHLTLPTILLV